MSTETIILSAESFSKGFRAVESFQRVDGLMCDIIARAEWSANYVDLYTFELDGKVKYCVENRRTKHYFDDLAEAIEALKLDRTFKAAQRFGSLEVADPIKKLKFD